MRASDVKIGQTIRHMYDGVLTITFKCKHRNYKGFMRIQGNRPDGTFAEIHVRCSDPVTLESEAGQ